MGNEAHEETAFVAVQEADFMKPLLPSSWNKPLGPTENKHAQHKHEQADHAHRVTTLATPMLMSISGRHKHSKNKETLLA